MPERRSYRDAYRGTQFVDTSGMVPVVTRVGPFISQIPTTIHVSIEEIVGLLDWAAPPAPAGDALA